MTHHHATPPAPAGSGEATTAARLKEAARYYAPIARDHDGEFSDVLVDEYGPGIPHQHWDAMREAGWFKYDHGSYILGSYETWRITDTGRAALTLPPSAPAEPVEKPAKPKPRQEKPALEKKRGERE